MSQRRGPLRARVGLALTAALFCTLLACSSLPKQVAQEPVYSGRLALSIQTTPAQSWSAGFELRGTARQGELNLLSPIGSSLARIQWDAQGAVLTRGARSETFPSLDSLLEQLSGTAWPAAVLFDWMQGRPTPTAGWELDLSQWAASGWLRARRGQPPVTELRLVLER